MFGDDLIKFTVTIINFRDQIFRTKQLRRLCEIFKICKQHTHRIKLFAFAVPVDFNSSAVSSGKMFRNNSSLLFSPLISGYAARKTHLQTTTQSQTSHETIPNDFLSVNFLFLQFLVFFLKSLIFDSFFSRS